jgi:hypothetical protein
MKFNPRGLIVTAVGALILWTVLQTHTIRVVDRVLWIVLVIVLFVLSVGTLVGTIRGRTAVGQVSALRELRRLFRG